MVMVFVSVDPSVSVTVMSYVPELAASGVPLSRPLAVSRASPAGSAGVTEKTTVPVQPDVLGTCALIGWSFVPTMFV